MRLVKLRAPGGLAGWDRLESIRSAFLCVLAWENLKLVEEDHPKPRPGETTTQKMTKTQIKIGKQKQHGVAIYDDLSNFEVIEQHLVVNFFGPLNMSRAFLLLLTRSKGAIVNNLSLAALAALPVIPAYSISKAAALNMTQSLRAILAGQGVMVHAVILGPIDTDMNRGFEIPKASPESAAAGIFDGMERGEEEIFPDPASQSIAEAWRTGAAKALERQFAAFVQAPAKNPV